MQLNNQVVSLELAKKMKELGFKQESLFYWTEYETEEAYIEQAQYVALFEEEEEKLSYSAYTVAELGEMLPPTIEDRDIKSYFQIEKNSEGKYFCTYTTIDEALVYIQVDRNLAEALARLLINLKGNNLL